MIKTIAIKEHANIKNELLKLLDAEESTPQVNEFTNMAKTDWFAKAGKPRKYFEYIAPVLVPYFKELFNSAFNINENRYDINNIKLDNYRFNQYSAGEYMGWHRHPGTSWHAIYYVELANNSPGTELLVPFTGEVIRPSVSEGDLMLSPSAYLHRSPANGSSERKTIIVFNFL